MTAVETRDVLVVGAGFGGLYSLYVLREAGFHVTAVERGSGVGGTWYWNRYPGARCDVESLQYSYSFDDDLQQDWEWTERYAGQPEILKYAQHVSTRFDLTDLIDFNTNVESMSYDADQQQWTVSTNSLTYKAKFVIAATGCLSSTNLPDFPGLEQFEGDTSASAKKAVADAKKAFEECN